MKVWILTDEYNDYDQHGEYFREVFLKKPTLEQLIDAVEAKDNGSNTKELLKFLLHLQSGGGRIDKEDHWYNLYEVEAK